MEPRIVRKGTWLYGGVVEESVDIVAIGFDWWYSLAVEEDHLEPGEEPMPLGPDGCIYYVRIQGSGRPPLPMWPDSPGHTDLAETMQYAEAKVVGGIRWHATVAA